MGRQVAGVGFLDAFLTHGRRDDLVALVKNRHQAESLVKILREHPSGRGRTRRLTVVEETRFHQDFFPDPPARIVYTPCPPDPRFAWARQHAGPHTYALCGVTHTLCSATAASLLCGLVTAPYEPYDALICTSRAVAGLVRTITENYSAYLEDRHGGNPRSVVRLETIPLGVDPDLYRPATPAERAEQRAKLRVADDEVVVLFVGRLSHHAKAHPYPMFVALADAARRTGKRVRLVLSGWAVNEPVRLAFVEGAKAFAPGVNVSIVNGTDTATRYAVWKAADVFTSLSDNIQETFGLVVIEAMASGLPVVATDWDGYRDLVIDGETGCLVPTRMVQGATADATSRLLFGETNYDYFLAAVNQGVAVAVPAAAEAYTRLIADASLRRTMGEAGRKRVLERFTWAGVVRAYEELWTSQEAERVAVASLKATAPPFATPALYPPPEHTFAGYPTAFLNDAEWLVATEDAGVRLPILLETPLTHYSGDRRVCDPSVLLQLLESLAKPVRAAEVFGAVEASGASPRAARATLAWMLKYHLVRTVS